MNADKLKILAMNDNGFVFDPSSGYSYTTNETGLAILKMLAEGLPKERIQERIMAEFEVGADYFDSDFEHYALMLEAYGMVEL